MWMIYLRSAVASRVKSRRKKHTNILGGANASGWDSCWVYLENSKKAKGNQGRGQWGNDERQRADSDQVMKDSVSQDK